MTDQYREIREYYVTVTLILVNAAVFVILALTGNPEDSDFMIRCGAAYPPKILEQGQYFRFITAIFLHFGIYHLANNMLVLAASGAILEKAMGHVKFGILYLGSGICGNILSYLHMLRSEYAVAAGASGAVFGIIGGLLWVVIVHRGHFERLSRKGMAVLIVLALYTGYTEKNVDNWAHLGGLAAGFLLAALMYRKKGRQPGNGKDIDFEG